MYPEVKKVNKEKNWTINNCLSNNKKCNTRVVNKRELISKGKNKTGRQ